MLSYLRMVIIKLFLTLFEYILTWVMKAMITLSLKQIYLRGYYYLSTW